MIEQGKCAIAYLEELISLGKTMQISAKCGLGQSSPNPFISILTQFGDEILAAY
jgi:[NiFe] hydrogenase diaphorase moiety large subunit